MLLRIKETKGRTVLQVSVCPLAGVALENLKPNSSLTHMCIWTGMQRKHNSLQMFRSSSGTDYAYSSIRHFSSVYPNDNISSNPILSSKNGKQIIKNSFSSRNLREALNLSFPLNLQANKNRWNSDNLEVCRLLDSRFTKP